MQPYSCAHNVQRGHASRCKRVGRGCAWGRWGAGQFNLVQRHVFLSVLPVLQEVTNELGNLVVTVMVEAGDDGDLLPLEVREHDSIINAATTFLQAHNFPKENALALIRVGTSLTNCSCS